MPFVHTLNNAIEKPKTANTNQPNSQKFATKTLRSTTKPKKTTNVPAEVTGCGREGDYSKKISLIKVLYPACEALLTVSLRYGLLAL